VESEDEVTSAPRRDQEAAEGWTPEGKKSRPEVQRKGEGSDEKSTDRNRFRAEAEIEESDSGAGGSGTGRRRVQRAAEVGRGRCIVGRRSGRDDEQVRAGGWSAAAAAARCSVPAIMRWNEMSEGWILRRR